MALGQFVFSIKWKVNEVNSSELCLVNAESKGQAKRKLVQSIQNIHHIESLDFIGEIWSEIK